MKKRIIIAGLVLIIIGCITWGSGSQMNNDALNDAISESIVNDHENFIVYSTPGNGFIVVGMLFVIFGLIIMGFGFKLKKRKTPA
jgi:hypothetical protein